ncbi:MAG: pseudaminic acid synthase [Gammaproteobacteria bacterium]|nr:pseudaminic acid synthase [Gammaproteobacteria bacterium]HJP19813.1 pseudaminic acid synthase [Nitrospinota bacterium]|tara:strand:- start:33036 stop:34088 length:1053 start_codon:yes stop_codon:yes gene_type:complete
MNEITIGDKKIGLNHPPFIIAEMSGNHNQSLENALKIVDTASKAGVSALKLQTYTADTITIDVKNNNFLISDPDSLWHGKTLYELYRQACTPWEWHKPIFERCRKLGLLVFSTPFDETAVDFLEDLNVPAYKIASFENIHIPLIRKVASTGKPLIISTGMASIAELDEAVRTARQAGCRNLVLLKCTSAYPATPENANLLTIPHLRQLFKTEVGLSDHTMGIGVSIASVALGATVIEKHFTLSRSDGGVDSAFSMEPDEMKMLVEETFKSWQALGKVHYGVTEKERDSIRFRRSIYGVENIRKEEKFTCKNLRVIRPGNGLPPKYYDILLKMKASRDIKRGTPIHWEYVE